MLPSKQKSSPPLTLETVFDVIKNVQSWQTLAENVYPRASFEPNTIQCQHVSNEACLKAVIEGFLSGKGQHKPSWRAVIWSLYQAKEIQLAEHIRSYAEPVQDHALTVENAIEVLKNVAVERRKNVWSRWGIVAYPQLKEIYQKYSTEEQRIYVCADIYVNCHPESSWTHLCQRLYQMKEMTAVRKAKTFIPQTEPSLTNDNVLGVIENVAVERRREVWSRQCIVPDEQLEDIYQNYSIEEQRIHACADIYVNCHPDSSWMHLCQGLYWETELTAARKAKTFISQTDPTLTVENVVGVMEKVTVGKAKNVWRRLIEENLFKDISSKCFTEKELMHTCADIYIKCNPDSSWKGIASGLYLEEETAAVEEVRSYLNPKDLTLSTEHLMELFALVDDKDVDDVGYYLDTPSSIRKEFKMNYQNPSQRKEAYLDYYVHNNPLASWTTIAEVLRNRRLHHQADVVKNTYIQGDNEDTSGEKEGGSATRNVPTGHILTKQELQVLGILLAPYTDGKLKEIQLSIQKKQGDISREDVELLLQQSGLAMIADRLKDDIEKGVENVKHYEAYKQALQNGISLTLRYLKFLFLGPPRSGKTTARRRLVREIINLSRLGQPSKSTGVAETNDVIIKKLVCESTAIVNSMWQSLRRSQSQGGDSGAQKLEGDLTYLAQWFYRLISTTTSDGPKITKQDTVQVASIIDRSSESDPPSNPRLLMQESHTCTAVRVESQNKRRRLNDSEELEIQSALDELTNILQSDSQVELQQLLEELTMINMVDVGGQPALMEMLPSLTIGPALYFLFFRLDQELGKSYQVRYHAIDKETEITLESSYCIEDVLYQSLSSIACFGCHSQKDNMSSRVLLFATYKDKVNDSCISEMASTLEEKLLKTKLYQEGLLLKTSKGELFFSLDNMNGDESEISEIRSDVEEIMKKHFSAIPIPAAWLMFRIVLHLLRKPVLSLAQCQAIASKLSMPTSVEEALWFFHHNIGNLMYYSGIPSMQEIVICDPQVIFDSISELIIDRFRHSNRSLSSHEVDDFHHKGQFSLAQIDDKTEQQRSGHLKLAQMVDLLKDLNIIAEIKEDEDEVDASAADQSQLPTAAYQSQLPATNRSQPKFIMPAVLKYASEEELKTPVVTNPDNQSVPIMIHFESGFVPFGVFCATIAHIIARQDSLSPKWRMCDDQVMRNKATFSIDGAFFTTVISRDQCLEIHVSRHPRARKRKSLSFICSTVRQTVVNSLQVVISKMKFKPYVKMDTLYFSSREPFDLTFTCCLEDSHSNHLMRVVDDSPSERYAKCLTEGMEINLEDKHMVWFDKELEKQSKSESHSMKAPVIPLRANEGNNTVLENPAQVVAATVQAADMKCPVCLNIQVDPCTLSCGHSICLLCLARLWKCDEKFCPVCKQTWREFPAISYDYRTSIEGSHSHEVDQIRKHYTEEDKLCIERYLETRNFSLKSERTAQKTLLTGTKEFEGEDICGLNNEQIALWLSDHPRLRGTDYQDDIQKLKEAKMDGSAFLILDKGSLEQFGLSTEFQTQLMKIFEEIKMYQLSLETKMHPHKQKSSKSNATTSTSEIQQPSYSSATTSGQQMQHVLISESVQPQTLLTDQPPMDLQPQPLAFSKNMNYEQLAMWLTKCPQFVGADYQEDINKLKGARINGLALLSLDESTLGQFGVSFGFQVTLMNIIENLKPSQKPPDSDRLPSQQQQSPASSTAPPTTQDQPISAGADKKMILLDEIPMLNELLILKYMDIGEKKKLRIISEASHKWKNIANLICGDSNVTTVLEQKCHDDPEECLKRTFIDNFISKKPQNYTQDWNGLIELLDDIGLETLAENVKQALPYACR